MHTAGGGSGDVIDLQDMSASQSATGGASAECRMYNAGTREGEQWYDEGLTFTYQNDGITPGSNADNYQMKWEGLSGDLPDNVSTPESTWETLGNGDFSVEWQVSGGPGESTGSVTVYIREGTGSTLATAVWDGEAIQEKKA